MGRRTGHTGCLPYLALRGRAKVTHSNPPTVTPMNRPYELVAGAYGHFLPVDGTAGQRLYCGKRSIRLTCPMGKDFGELGCGR